MYGYGVKCITPHVYHSKDGASTDVASPSCTDLFYNITVLPMTLCTPFLGTTSHQVPLMGAVPITIFR